MKKVVLFLALCAGFISLQAQTDNTKSNNNYPEVTVEDEIFVVVEKMPEFPGGNEAMAQYITDNIKYPQKAKRKKISGKVFVSFIVEKDGSVSNVEVIRGIGGGCDEEAIRVVSNMPKWEPGTQRGKPVRVKYILPLNFKI